MSRRFGIMGALALLCSPAWAENSDTMPAPLTTTQGDPQRGRAVFVSRDLGHCVLCHSVSGIDVPFQGNLGPKLDGVGLRLSPGQLRFRIVDYSQLNPTTTMPPYFRTENLNQVAEEYEGKPVLSAQEVEDLISWLSTLDGSTK